MQVVDFTRAAAGHMYIIPSNMRRSSKCGDGRGESVPLRLLDCFLLVTPVESDAFGAFLGAGCAERLFFLTGVGMLGTGSDTFKAKEGEEMVTVSAICHAGGMRYALGASIEGRSTAAVGQRECSLECWQSELVCSDGSGERSLS